MLFYSNAKINLGLNILNKRADGYHNIQSVLYPIPFYDFIDVIISKDFSYTNTGIQVDCALEKNLCFKAYQILKHKLPSQQAISIHHHKIVPAQMGLGGGSANATIILKAINQLFSLNLSPQQFTEYAEKLGNDCAFFVNNTPSIARATGAHIESINFTLSGHDLILYLPQHIAINTQWAYSNIKPNAQVEDIKTLIAQPINQWKQCLKNDFENVVFKTHPELQNIKENFYKQGAIYSSLSGSGACVYGIFKSKEYQPNAFSYPLYWITTL